MSEKMVVLLLQLFFLTATLSAQTVTEDSVILERLKLIRKAHLVRDSALKSAWNCIDFEKTVNPPEVNDGAVTYYRNCEWSGTYIILNKDISFKYVHNGEGPGIAVAKGTWKKEKHRVLVLKFDKKTPWILSKMLGASTGGKHQTPGHLSIQFIFTKDKLVPFDMLKADSIDRVNSKSVSQSGKDITRLQVSLSDSSASLTANIRRDHRIFGYETPSVNAARKILISVFTNDVQDNPFRCPMGAYYETSEMEGMEIKFAGFKNGFARMKILKEAAPVEIVYILRKWIEFSK